MKSKFFNSPVITPTLTGAAMHAQFSEGDLLFDWVSFEIPRGVARLIGATTIIRPKGDADPTHQPAGIDLVFAKDTAVSATPATLGTLNSPAILTPRHDIIGSLPSVDSDIIGGGTAVISTTKSPGIVLEPETNSGGNVGVDKYWVAGIAAGLIDFRSIIVVDDADIASAAHTTIVTGGTSMDNREHFIAGDVIHAQDGAVVGTLASVAESAITLTAELGTSILTNGDTLYCINPIKLTLHFSK